MKQLQQWIYSAGLVLVLWCAGTPRAEAVILISELLADPGGDANRDGSLHATRDEFVELFNTGSQPVSLADWSLTDLVRERHVFEGSASIPPGGFYVVFGGGNPQGFQHADTASTGSLGLNNSGDTVTLLDANAALVDAVTYGAEGGRDVSLTRSPDGTGPFVPHSSVSPDPFSPGAPVAEPGESSEVSEPEAPSEPAEPNEPAGSTDPIDPGRQPADMILPPSAGPMHLPTVPEPSSLALLGSGLLGLSLRRRK